MQKDSNREYRNSGTSAPYTMKNYETILLESIRLAELISAIQSQKVPLDAELTAFMQRHHDRRPVITPENPVNTDKTAAILQKIGSTGSSRSKALGLVPKRKIYLICINPGGPDEDTGLELHETYTSPGMITTEDGLLCYAINEMDGGPKKVERFIEYKKNPKTSTKK